MIKRPRRHSESHLEFVRQLPCVVCGDPTSTEAAHIRFACDEVGKRFVGIGEKPDDLWTIPLCGAHHRMQHESNERKFWQMFDRDPIVIALALWAHTGQHDVGTKIAREAGR